MFERKASDCDCCGNNQPMSPPTTMDNMIQRVREIFLSVANIVQGMAMR